MVGSNNNHPYLTDYSEEYIGEEANQLRRASISYSAIPNLRHIALEYYKNGVSGSHSLPLTELGVQIGDDEFFSFSPPPSFFRDFWSFNIEKSKIEGAGTLVWIETRVKEGASLVAKASKEISINDEGLPNPAMEYAVDLELFRWVFENPGLYHGDGGIMHDVNSLHLITQNYYAGKGKELGQADVDFGHFAKMFNDLNLDYKTRKDVEMFLADIETGILAGSSGLSPRVRKHLGFLRYDSFTRHEAENTLLDYMGELEIKLSGLRGKAPMSLGSYEGYSSLQPHMKKISAEDEIKNSIDASRQEIRRLALGMSKLANAGGDGLQSAVAESRAAESRKYAGELKAIAIGFKQLLGNEKSLSKILDGEAKKAFAEHCAAEAAAFASLKKSFGIREKETMKKEIAKSAGALAKILEKSEANGRQKKLHVSEELNIFFSKRHENFMKNRRRRGLDTSLWTSLPLPRWPVSYELGVPFADWTAKSGIGKGIFSWLSDYLHLMAKYDGTLSYASENTQTKGGKNSPMYSSMRWLYVDLAIRSLKESGYSTPEFISLFKKVRYFANKYEDESGNLPKVLSRHDKFSAYPKANYLRELMEIRRELLSSVQELLKLSNAKVATPEGKVVHPTASANARKMLIFYLMEVGGWVDAKGEEKLLKEFEKYLKAYAQPGAPGSKDSKFAEHSGAISRNIGAYIGSLHEWNARTNEMYGRLCTEKEEDTSSLKSAQNFLNENFPIHAKTLSYSIAQDRFHNAYKSGEPCLSRGKNAFSAELLGLAAVSMAHEVLADSAFWKASAAMAEQKAILLREIEKQSKSAAAARQAPVQQGEEEKQLRIKEEEAMQLRIKEVKAKIEVISSYVQEKGKKNPFYLVNDLDTISSIEQNTLNLLSNLFGEDEKQLNHLFQIRGNGKLEAGRKRVLSELVPSCPSFSRPERDVRDLITRLIHGSTPNDILPIKQEPIKIQLMVHRLEQTDKSGTYATYTDNLGTSILAYFEVLEKNTGYRLGNGTTLADEAFNAELGSEKLMEIAGNKDAKIFYDFDRASKVVRDLMSTQDHYQKLIIGDEGLGESGTSTQFAIEQNAKERLNYIVTSLGRSVEQSKNKDIVLIHTDRNGKERHYEFAPEGIKAKFISPAGEIIPKADYGKISSSLSDMADFYVILKKQTRIHELLTPYTRKVVHKLVENQQKQKLF